MFNRKSVGPSSALCNDVTGRTRIRRVAPGHGQFGEGPAAAVGLTDRGQRKMEGIRAMTFGIRGLCLDDVADRLLFSHKPTISSANEPYGAS